MVSVIVLTYEHEAYIAQALDSILMQETDFSYEILIGDDASSDGTSDIVRKYAQAYPQTIQAFIREQNLGATRNLYDLLKRARGKYIASCEGDDFWSDPQKLQIQVDFLENQPEHSGCAHIVKVIDESGNSLGSEPKWICQKEHYTLKDFKGVYLPGQPASLVHKNFFLDESHDYSIIYRANTMIADRTISLILALQGPIYRMDRIMSCYRRHEYNDSQSATAVFFQKNQYVNQMQIEFTRRLEHYAKEEFSVHVSFTRFKLEQFVKAKIRAVLRAVSSIWRRYR